MRNGSDPIPALIWERATVPHQHASQRWQRYVRFSLRTFMVFVLAFGVWLGWLVRTTQIQREAVAVIEKKRGSVWYHGQSSRSHSPNPSVRLWWPTWLVDRLGVDYFGHVIRADIRGFGPSDPEWGRIGDLAQLEKLQIRGRAFDAELVNLKRLTSLSVLVLEGTEVTDLGLAQLKGHTSLRVLDLDGTRISDAGLANLKGLTNLSALDLRFTRVSDSGLLHLNGLAGLSELHLDGTQVTDRGLAQLKGLAGLTVLGLGHTQVTDLGLVQLKGLTRLELLSLTDTPISDAGITELKRALPWLTINY